MKTQKKQGRNSMKPLILAVILLCNCAALSQRARVNIDTTGGKFPALDAAAEVVQLKDGNAVPDSFEMVAQGEFWTGPATIKCGERYMIECTERKAREIGADAFRFYDVKEPNMIINTCYKAKILFLKRRK